MYANNKIILVCNTSWGMMMFRLGLMKQLLVDGYEVTVLAPKDGSSDDIKKLGVNFIELPMQNKGSNPFSDLRMTFRLFKHYQNIKPLLVFTYTVKPNVFGAIAAKFANVKSIAVVTGLGYTFINHTLTSKIAKKLYRFSLKYSNKVWFINYEDRNKFVKDRLIKRELIELLPSEGVDMKKYLPRQNRVDDGKFIFVLIARLLWDKGVGELVQAASILKKDYPNVEVQLVGFVSADNPKAISKQIVKSWEKLGLIKYMGSTNDVRDFIGNADCVVLPSYREGISKILLESASMAKPIIASNVPGCRDIVENGVSGYICKVKDPVDLAHKMQRIMKMSNSQLHEMGIKGRLHVQKEYDEEIIIDKYIKTIESFTKDICSRKFTLKNFS